MWFVTLIALIGSFQAPAVSFETEISPGEGRLRLRATGPILVREQPDSKRPVAVTLRVPLDRDLAFDKTIYRTITPGEFRVRVVTTIAGRVLGRIDRLSREDYYRGNQPRASVEVAPPSSVEYLQYRAEGTCFVRFNADVIDADDCPTMHPGAFLLVNEPKTELWIRLTQDLKPVGWVLVDEKRIKVVGRSF